MPLKTVKALLSFSLCIFCSYSISAQIVESTPAEQRMASMRAKAAFPANKEYNDVRFKSIGPTVMSGRVVDVDVNPDDPTEFYVAYATGGVWHTLNNGQSFKPITDSLAEVFGVGDIAVNWKKRIIWLGTGEVNSSRSSYAGTGIYKSDNNGKTWTYIGLPESHHIGKIQLHPTNDNIAWVAVLGHLYSPNKERGVYKTTDGGQSWKQTLYKDENTGAIDIDIDVNNPNNVYAALWYRTRRANKFVESGSTSGIYKSTDGGDTWSLISGAGSGFMKGSKIGRIGIATYAKNANILYAVVDNNESKPVTKKVTDSFYTLATFKDISKEKFLQLKPSLLDTFLKNTGLGRSYTARQVLDDVKNDKLKPSCISDYFDADDGFQNTGIIGCEVYRSDDAGKSWKKTHDSAIGIYNTYGYYFAKVFISPYNDQKVFITGFYMQMSTDGGKKFKTIDKDNVHPDHHALWINPKKDSHLINGNDGGVNISYDNGDNWFLANTPAVGQFYAITVDDARPYRVYGGLQDNGVWYAPSTAEINNAWHSTGQNPYKSINGGDGMQVQVDKRDNKTVYSGSQFGVYNRQHLDSTNRRSAVSVRPQHVLGEKPLRFNWQTPILLSTWNQDIFYIGANKLYRSFNKGENLEAISPDLTKGKVEGNVPYGTITTIAESSVQYGLLYVGTDDGNIYKTSDAGHTWQKISDNLPQSLWVSRVVAGKHKAGRVYVTLNGYRYDHFAPYVFVSDDYGATWQNISGNLPMEPVNVLREDEKKTDVIYVGTDGGLYVSTDAGKNYGKWDNGLPKSVPIHDIVIQARENEIVLGTHGRSLYIAKLNDVGKKSK